MGIFGWGKYFQRRQGLVVTARKQRYAAARGGRSRPAKRAPRAVGYHFPNAPLFLARDRLGGNQDISSIASVVRMVNRLSHQTSILRP
jgi:hypothetical protein